MKIKSLLEPEKCNSAFLKKTLGHHLFWQLHFSVVVDEFCFMDMFGLRRNGYGVEFEIKISKADFDREIRIIRCNKQPMRWGKDWDKWTKHRDYLGIKYEVQKTPVESLLADNGHQNQPRFRPNEFYFYVPDFLAEYAVSKVEGLPYGVIKIGATANSYGHEYFWNYTVARKAKKLHTEKVPASIIWDMAHALSVRNRLLN